MISIETCSITVVANERPGEWERPDIQWSYPSLYKGVQLAACNWDMRDKDKREGEKNTLERGWTNNYKSKQETQQHINQTLKLKSIRKLQKYWQLQTPNTVLQSNETPQNGEGCVGTNQTFDLLASYTLIGHVIFTFVISCYEPSVSKPKP